MPRAAARRARFVRIVGVDAILIALRRIGNRAALLMDWAGMRGVATLAVALSLPETMPARDLLLVIAAVTAGCAELVHLHRAVRIEGEILHDFDLAGLGAIAAKG